VYNTIDFKEEIVMKEKNQIDSKAIEIKLKNLTFIVILGFLIVILLIIGLYFKGGVKSSSSGSSSSSSSNETVKYDVSKMKQITGDEAAKLFDEKGTHFLYIGRSTCSVCVSLVPELNTAINDMTLTLNYSPLNSTFRTDFKNLFDKLDIETKVNNNEGTYGELLEEYGYTPVVIVIKDGKMVDGFIGYRDADKIEELFKKYL